MRNAMTNRRSLGIIGALVALAIVAALFMLMVGPAQAGHSPGTTVFVDTNAAHCPGVGDGTEALPFCTLQEGVNHANAGDTVDVAAGTYTETAIGPDSRLHIDTDGLTVRSQDGAELTVLSHSASPGVFITASNVVFEGFTIRDTSLPAVDVTGAGIVVRHRGDGTTGGQNNTIRGNIIDGTGRATGDLIPGVQVYGPFGANAPSDTVIEDNEIKNWGVAIQLGGTHLALNTIIRDNVLSDSVSYGIGVDRAPGTHVTDNEIFNVGSAGVYVVNRAGRSVAGTVVERNVIRDNTDRGVRIRGDGGLVEDVHFALNEISGNVRGIHIEGVPGIGDNVLIGFNCVQGNTRWGLQNGQDQLADATNNWWGDASGPSGVGSGTGDAVSSNVDFDPWLTVRPACGLPPLEPEPPFATEIVGPVELRTVDQRREPSADIGCPGDARNCRELVDGAVARAFDRDDEAVGKNPSQADYEEIWDTVDPVAECTTDADGTCTLVEPGPGNYLIIVRFEDGDNVIFVGKPKSENEFVEVEPDVWEGPQKEFQVIKLVRRDESVQYSGGVKVIVAGSYLEILYPEFAVWDDVEGGYVYPFIFTSDSDWSVDVCASVPQGYNIVGVYDENGDLVSDSDCAQTFVTGETRVVAFEVEMVGSPEPVLNARLRAKGPGGKVTPLNLDVKGVRIAKEKSGGRVPSEGSSGGPPSGAWLPLAPLVAGGLVGALGVVGVSRRLRRRR